MNLEKETVSSFQTTNNERIKIRNELPNRLIPELIMIKIDVENSPTQIQFEN